MDESQAPEYSEFEMYIDYAGQERQFWIYHCPTYIHGYLVRAQEFRNEAVVTDGYEFETTAQSLVDAVSRLHHLIRQGISTRYLHQTPQGLTMAHDWIKGRISHGGLSVDGQFVSFKDLNRLMQTHEGFEISIRISSDD